MPLSQWTAFYGAVTAAHYEADAMAVVIAHPKDPRKLHQSLLRAAARARGGKRAGIDLLAPPEEVKRALRGAGVQVVEEKKPQ